MSRPATSVDPLFVALSALGVVVVVQAASVWSPALGFGLVALPVLLCLMLFAAFLQLGEAYRSQGQVEITAKIHAKAASEIVGPNSGGVLNESVPLDERLVQPFSPIPFSWEAEAVDDGGVMLQEWSRRIDAEGLETLSGKLRIEFVEGCRTAVAHVPWQPMFFALPDVSLEPIEGDEAEVRIEELRSWGMRLSARRSESIVGFTLVEFHVQARHVQRRAA